MDAKHLLGLPYLKIRQDYAACQGPEDDYCILLGNFQQLVVHSAGVVLMVRYFVSIEGHTHLSLSKSASWTKLVRTQALHISRGLPKHVHGASYVIADMLFLDREKR